MKGWGCFNLPEVLEAVIVFCVLKSAVKIWVYCLNLSPCCGFRSVEGRALRDVRSVVVRWLECNQGLDLVCGASNYSKVFYCASICGRSRKSLKYRRVWVIQTYSKAREYFEKNQGFE